MGSYTELEAVVQGIITNTIDFDDLSDSKSREVIDKLFPSGVAFHYSDPKIEIGDSVFGRGVSDINSSGFFFGVSTVKTSVTPITLNAHITPDIEM